MGKAEAKTLAEDLHDLTHVLLPFLRGYREQGWPGLSALERQEAADALWELETTLLEMEGR